MGAKKGKFRPKSKKIIAQSMTKNRVMKKSNIAPQQMPNIAPEMPNIAFITNVNVTAEHNYALSFDLDCHKTNNDIPESQEAVNYNQPSENVLESCSDIDCHKTNNDIPESQEAVNSNQPNENVLESNLKSSHIKGRRIVDIAYLFQQIQNINLHSPINGICNFSTMEYYKEIRQGLKSNFFFKCKICGFKKYINSNQFGTENDMLDLNYASTLASYAIGTGFSQTQEFFANIEIPFMSSSTYDKQQKTLQRDLKVCAESVTREALEKERQIAIKQKPAGDSSMPSFAVKSDGSWAKRAFGKSYKSLSGAACLIGLQTNKIIWHGTKNKYCKKCANNSFRDIKTDHDCNTNYHGSPTGMESELIVEAFKGSEKNFGVRFSELIADGDSKTFKALTDARIYKNPPLKIDKRECCVHLYRRARGSLWKLNDKGGYMNSAKLDQIIIGIKCARKHWSEMDLPFHEKANKLRQNILRVPHHVFGNHEKCDSYYCDYEKHKSDVNHIPDMQKSGELQNIYEAIGRLIDNVQSLLLNYNTNHVECFNSVIVKHTGGKRLNFTSAGSQTGRVDASAIDFNTKRLGSTMLQYKLEISENDLKDKIIYKLESQRANRNLTRNSNRPYHKSSYQPDDKYNPDTGEQIDLDTESYECRKSILLEHLQCNQKNRLTIERDTIGKSYNSFWDQIHSQIILASFFGQICRGRSIESYPSLISNIKDETHQNTAQKRHDKNTEHDVIDLLVSTVGWKLSECGIFIDEEFEFLGASPDRLINDDGIVAIKCPYKAKDMYMEEAIAKKEINFWKTTKRPRKAPQKKMKMSTEPPTTDKPLKKPKIAPKKKIIRGLKKPKDENNLKKYHDGIGLTITNDSIISRENWSVELDNEICDTMISNNCYIQHNNNQCPTPSTTKKPVKGSIRIAKKIPISDIRKAIKPNENVTDSDPTATPNSYKKPTRKALKRKASPECENIPNILKENLNGDSQEHNEEFRPKIIGVNKNSDWYYQIQGELHISKRSYCLLVVWTNKEMKIDRIEKDDTFWTNEIQPKVVGFFENGFLPDFIQSKR